MAASAAAVVHGFATLDPRVPVAGVILNQVGSDSHERQLRDALGPLGLPVLGVLRRDDQLVWRDRHLGLVPVAEHPDAVRTSLARLAAVTAEHVDLATVVRLARSAPERTVDEVPLPRPLGRPLRIGVTGGPAFTFTYTDTLDCLAAAGAEAVPFDPLRTDRLPERLDGLLLGGGFPEVHLEELAANRPLHAALAEAVRGRLPTWAECGGLLWLCRSLDGRPGVGLVDADARMTERLTLGYRTATTRVDSPIGPAGTVLRGHEFHYAVAEPAGSALELTHPSGTRLEGHATASLLATFLHHHPGGDPARVEAFLATCAGQQTPGH
jgi:cobyrinic acid a,c-diamide synthase